MAYVITQNCCKDASCVPVCPVDCIRPVTDDDDFSTTQSLYIDPVTCIDCGACLEECPVDAIHYEDDLPAELEPFKDLNAAYFERHPLTGDETAPRKQHDKVDSLRVAVVGSGPAGCYAVKELIGVDGLEVDVYERLKTPFGLVRAGVAPDHQHTKSITSVFDPVFNHRRVRCHFGVEVGVQVSHDELMAHHHAVIYAVGTDHGRELGIPGETSNGVHSAADFVSWYNGHPDHVKGRYDLSGERAAIVGNGNVALDVARMLVLDEDALAATDMAQYAVDALCDSMIREVVILGRRGAWAAAFSAGEFLALGHLPGVDVIIEGDDLQPGPDDDVETTFALNLLRQFDQRPSSPDNKRIVFRFNTTPVEFVGEGHVTGIRVRSTVETSAEDTEVIDTSLVLRSIGYLGKAVNGLPFDPANGVVPNDGGRVVDEIGGATPGVYVTGWIKRGPHGVIGTNRTCAQQTVDRMWDDYDSGLLNRPVSGRAELMALLEERGATVGDWTDWRRIDRAERERGAELSRPRLKFTEEADMLTLMGPRSGPTA
jgi:ferredoxin/flavodoxin---NADP+ reductase